MTPFEVSLLFLERALRITRGQREHALFGSASLVVRGVLDRTPQDIDAFVTKKVWGLLLPRPGWRVETPHAGDPPILAYGLDTRCPIHLFFDWSDPHCEMDPHALLRDAEYVEHDGHTFRCISIEEALRHKKEALDFGSLKVQKHRPDIEKIEKYLAERG